MPKKDLKIDKDWLYEQYITNRRSTPDIAKELGCSHSFVSNTLKRLDIPLRTASTCKFDSDNTLSYLTNKEWLYEQYYTNKYSIVKIAEMVGCSASPIISYMNKHGIDIRSLVEAQNNGNIKLLDDKEWLHNEYVINRRMLKELGIELGCSGATVKNYLKKHNIPIRSMQESKLINVDSDKLSDANWLYEQYTTNKRTLKDLSAELGYMDGGGALKKHLQSSGISTRNNSETQIKNPEALPLLNNYEWLYEQYVTNNKSSSAIASMLECTHKTVLKFLNYHNIDIEYTYKRSGPEMEIADFLTDEGIVYRTSDRNKISPLELDIFIEDKNIAIELNGIYWHSLDRDNDFIEKRQKHLYKYNVCKDVGVELLQFTCVEWAEKKEIVKSIILNKLGKSKTRIFARKCEIKKVEKADEIKFFNENHIQGHGASTVCIGLMYAGEYVCMLSMGSPRYNKSFDYEIIRIATKLNTTVVGGVSKLFSEFIRNNNTASIITYANLRYATGKIYETLGFTFSHKSDIGFKWIKNGMEYNRCQFQKHKLPTKLKTYDATITASENMFLNGYRKLYDCGQMVYVMGVSTE